MAEYVSIGGDHQGLRNRAPPVHQRRRRLVIYPAQAEAEIEVARELLNAFGRGARIFSGQTDELYATPGELFAHLLVFRNFPAARSAPRRPEVNYENLAAEVRETEATLVERHKLALKDAFRQDGQLRPRDGRALGR